MPSSVLLAQAVWSEMVSRVHMPRRLCSGHLEGLMWLAMGPER